MFNRQKKKATMIDTSVLPTEILLHIFSFLKAEHRLLAGMACSSWYEIATDRNFKAENMMAKQFQLFKRKCINECQEMTQKQALLAQCDTILSTNVNTINIALMGEIANRILFLPDSQGYSSIANSRFAEKNGIKTSFAGGKKIQLSSVPASDLYARTLKVFLKDTNILLVSLCKEKDSTSQLIELDKKLATYKNDCLVLIVNSEVNAGKYLSVSLLKEDTLQSFYGRIAQVIYEAKNSFPPEVENPESEYDDRNTNAKRCTVS